MLINIPNYLFLQLICTLLIVTNQTVAHGIIKSHAVSSVGRTFSIPNNRYKRNIKFCNADLRSKRFSTTFAYSMLTFSIRFNCNSTYCTRCMYISMFACSIIILISR